MICQIYITVMTILEFSNCVQKIEQKPISSLQFKNENEVITVP